MPAAHPLLMRDACGPRETSDRDDARRALAIRPIARRSVTVFAVFNIGRLLDEISIKAKRRLSEHPLNGLALAQLVELQLEQGDERALPRIAKRGRLHISVLISDVELK